RLGTSARYLTPGRRRMLAITSAAPAMAGTARGDTNETASISRRPDSARASTSAARWDTVTGASAWSPSRGPTSRMRTEAGRADVPDLPAAPALTRGSHRRHAVAPLGEAPGLALRHGQTADELAAEVLGLDHGVDNQVRRQPQKVHVGFVLGPPLGHERSPLGGVLDGRDAVGVNRVHRRLR